MAATQAIYDYIVIGGGSGGLASARRAASYGARVLLIEEARLGGTCVNVGCVPKKVMFHAAGLAEGLKAAKAYGFTNVSGSAQTGGFQWGLLKTARDAYIKRLNDIYRSNLVREGVHIVNGRGRLLAPGRVLVQSQEEAEGGIVGGGGGGGEKEEEYHGKHILIATGSYPVVPNDVPGAHLGITSDGFFELEEQPQNVAIIGSGYIAVELAAAFHGLGSRVHLWCRREHVLSHFDETMHTTLHKEMLTDGIEITNMSQTCRIDQSDAASGAPKLSVVYTRDGQEHTSTGHDLVLWAIGRHTRTDAFADPQDGKILLEMTPQGHVVTDAFQNTSMPNVCAIGDVCGKYMLTPVAIAAGRHLADRLFGGKPDAKLDYDEYIPSVIFSHPPIGAVGLTEAEAIARHGKDKIKVYQSRFVGLYYGVISPDAVDPPIRRVQNVYKLIALLPEERIIGLHIIGRDSEEILQGFAVAMKMGATKRDFDRTMAIHPTAGEELVTMR